MESLCKSHEDLLCEFPGDGTFASTSRGAEPPIYPLCHHLIERRRKAGELFRGAVRPVCRFKFHPPPVQRSHYALADNKGQFASSIFVPHKPGDGFCLNTERVSSLNLIRPLRNHGSGEPWLKFSRAATSERNQGKRGVPGNVHVRPSSARLIETL